MNWNIFLYFLEDVVHAKTGYRKVPSFLNWWKASGQERIDNSAERRKPLLASGVP